MDYNDLNRVLKYGVDDAHNLLRQIEGNPEHQAPNSNLRLVAADALQETGREPEAHLLRSEHPIYFRNGKVHHARGYSGDANRFLRGYYDAAFFSSTDHESAEPLDANYGISDLLPDTKEQMVSDAQHFYHSYHHLIPDGNAEHAGHDFWYNRNGHGTGFWDKPELYGEHADALSEASHQAGEYNIEPVPLGDPELAHPEYGIGGYGGRSGWGQPEGLHTPQ
jgi:hypothetical protein